MINAFKDPNFNWNEILQIEPFKGITYLHLVVILGAQEENDVDLLESLDFSRLNWNAQPSEGSYVNYSPLSTLMNNFSLNPRKWIRVIAKLATSENINWDLPDNLGKTPLYVFMYVLHYHMDSSLQKELVDVLEEFLNKENLNLSATCKEGSNQGATPLFWLIAAFEREEPSKLDLFVRVIDKLLEKENLNWNQSLTLNSKFLGETPFFKLIQVISRRPAFPNEYLLRIIQLKNTNWNAKAESWENVIRTPLSELMLRVHGADICPEKILKEIVQNEFIDWTVSPDAINRLIRLAIEKPSTRGYLQIVLNREFQRSPESFEKFLEKAISKLHVTDKLLARMLIAINRVQSREISASLKSALQSEFEILEPYKEIKPKKEHNQHCRDSQWHLLSATFHESSPSPELAHLQQTILEQYILGKRADNTYLPGRKKDFMVPKVTERTTREELEVIRKANKKSK